MKKVTVALLGVLSLVLLAPAVFALSASITNGFVTDIGVNQMLTNFGMITGTTNFQLGNFSWPATEIWLLPTQIDPDVFNKGVTQLTTIEIPVNMTWSTCRTAIYNNETVGYGFKIYNTGSTKQILDNGTFCGLAYSGTYFIYAKY